ncbi:hypothetical protein [Millionella massiliensis]|uniref:hypothetical protein n=1 Tax=Millionella massiliensis TaxID=1871023 RepID=UPI0024B6D040|nr:hypothetical protein [Millionella massiliensis]
MLINSCREQILAPPRARGRRPRRAVGERLLYKTKARFTAKRPISLAANRSFRYHTHSRAFQNTRQFIVDSTELPSRRAGGAAGTPTDCYLLQMKVIRFAWSLYGNKLPLIFVIYYFIDIYIMLNIAIK